VGLLVGAIGIALIVLGYFIITAVRSARFCYLKAVRKKRLATA